MASSEPSDKVLTPGSSSLLPTYDPFSADDPFSVRHDPLAPRYDPVAPTFDPQKPGFDPFSSGASAVSFVQGSPASVAPGPQNSGTAPDDYGRPTKIENLEKDTDKDGVANVHDRNDRDGSIQ